jgi:hypothetical protein
LQRAGQQWRKVLPGTLARAGSIVCNPGLGVASTLASRSELKLFYNSAAVAVVAAFAALGKARFPTP